MNRYGNILPYDSTRVILSHPINGCDYVNASWIRGRGRGEERQGNNKVSLGRASMDIFTQELYIMVFIFFSGAS